MTTDRAGPEGTIEREETKGPIIVWTDYGYEGWSPQSFPSLIDAITAGAITRYSVVTQRIDMAKHVTEPAPACGQPPETG